MVRAISRAVLSSMVLCVVAVVPPLRAAPTTVEVVDGRTRNQRLWRTTETVAVEEPLTGAVRMEERTSQVVEVGDFLCYRDGTGGWVPSSPRWTLDGGVFVSAGAGYKLIAPCSSGETMRYFPAEDDSEVALKLHGLSAVDGDRREVLREVRAGIEGKILETHPAKLVYPDALGEAIDVEVELTASGIHQNVVIRKTPSLPAGMSEISASLVLETEINLDEITAPSGRTIEVAGQSAAVPRAGETTEAAAEDLISFSRSAGGGGSEPVWSFGVSRILESTSEGLRQKAIAAKRLGRARETNKTHLYETLPFKVLAEAADSRSLPLVWDFETIQANINQNTVWRGGSTFWVKNCTVTGATLTIEPGATIKRQPGTTFAFSTGGRLIAIGEPYAMITFTSADDGNCGEEITEAGMGRPGALVEIFQGAASDSAIRYCKFTRAQDRLLSLFHPPSNSIQNSVFLTDTDSPFESFAIYAYNAGGAPYLTVKNNLFVSKPGQTPVTCIRAFYLFSLMVENNTFARGGTGTAVFNGVSFTTTSGSLTARENIFSDCTDPINLSGGYYPTITANAYKPTAEPQDSAPLVLATSPFVSNGLLGDFYLSPTSSCRNYASARTANAAGMNDPVFTVDEPSKWGQWYQSNQTLTSLTVSRHVLYPSPSTNKVCLGYHAPRVDAVIGNVAQTDAVIEVITGAFTIEENAVLAVGGEGEVQPRGSFTCLGNPRNKGWNYVINPQGASSIVESTLRSPRKGDGTLGNAVVVGLSNPTVQLEFTRFVFLGSALVTGFAQTFTFPAKSCRFEWCSLGMWAFLSSISAKNCLFRDCFLGMSTWEQTSTITAELCTFDRCRDGIRVDHGTVIAKDCLFSSNDGGEGTYGFSVGIEMLSGTVNESHNGFHKLNTDITGQGIHERSVSLPDSNSPYNRIHPQESTWFLRGRVNNPANPFPAPEDIIISDMGSKRLDDYALSGSMSASKHAIRDTGVVDIGYHWPVLDAAGASLPAEWKSYFSVTNPGSDEDADAVSNLEEYLNETNPKKSDTDDDRYISETFQEVGLDGPTAPEIQDLGFANGPSRADLRRGPYLQISKLDATGVTFRVYWAFDNDWWPPGGPQRAAFLLRQSGESQFTEVGFMTGTDSSVIETCMTATADCFNGFDNQLEFMRVTLSDLTRGALFSYKIRYEENPGNPPARTVETPVYTFRVPQISPTSFAFIVYGGTTGKITPEPEYLPIYNKEHELLIEKILADLSAPEFAEVAQKMLFAIHLGDFAWSGFTGYWRDHLFNPAAKLQRAIPVLPVVGDRDFGSRDPFGPDPRLETLRGFLDYPAEPRFAFDPAIDQFQEVNYSFDLGRARFVFGDTLEGAASTGLYGGFILGKVNDIADDENFDWRFVFFHIPGYSHSLMNPFTPHTPPSFPTTPDGLVREALYSTGLSLAAPSRHVTLVANAHNRLYERAQIGDPSPLTQLVIGRAGPLLIDPETEAFEPEDDPWTNLVPYVDDLREPGVRKIPRDVPEVAEREELEGWLGYALVLVAPDGVDPAVVRVTTKQYSFDELLFPPVLDLAFEETLDLLER